MNGRHSGKWEYAHGNGGDTFRAKLARVDLELRHLRAVCAIADAGSVSRAAAVLGVAQPSLTTQLRRIEEVLGGPLYSRGRSGVVPTELGEFVLVNAREILSRVRELRVHSLSMSAGARLPVRLGGMPGIFFTSMLDHLQTEMPSRPIASRTEQTVAEVLDLLGRHSIDGTIVHQYPGFAPTFPESVRYRAIIEAPEFVILPAGHRLAPSREVRLADLSDENWVLPQSSGDGFRGCLRGACESAGFSPYVAHEIADTESAVAVIRRGRGIGIASAIFVPRPGLVVRPLRENPIRCTYLIAWLADRPIAHYVEGLVDQVRHDYTQQVLSSPFFAEWLDINHVDDEKLIDPWTRLDLSRREP